MIDFKTPELLIKPVSVNFSAEKIKCMVDAGIATSWDIGLVNQGKGWLSEVGQYIFRRSISIEGPCGFYGGLYGPNVWTAEGGLCTMGAASYSHSPVPEGLVVGRYCSIGKELKFLDFAHPIDWVSSAVAFFKPLGAKKLTAIHQLIDDAGGEKDSFFHREMFDPKLGEDYPIIGHDVWIGERVTLALGIKIGTGSVIAAGAVVTRDVPPYSIVAGVPAKVKRFRFDESTIERLLKSHWWEYHFSDLQKLDITQPKIFLDRIENLQSVDGLTAWNPPALNFPDDLIVED